MVIPLSYIHCGDYRQRTCEFNTITGAISGAIKDDYIAPYCDGNDNYVVYQDSNWTVYAMFNYPYFFAASGGGGGGGCAIQIDSVSSTPDNGTANGTLTINASGVGSIEYRIQKFSVPTYDSGWVGGNVFNSLVNGTYFIQVRNALDTDCFDFRNAIVQLQQPLQASASKTDLSANGAGDGSIVVTALYGSGNYEVEFAFDSSTYPISGSGNSITKSGLAAGTYAITVTDLTTAEVVNLSVLLIEPAIPAPASNFFFVPKMNSLEFVHEVTPDGCSIHQTPDNVRFCKQTHPYFGNTEYHQKVAKCDALVIQFQSNYEEHTAKLKNYLTNEVVSEYVISLAEKNLARESIFPILIRNHGNNQSRVYFNTGSIPLELKLEVGDSFFIVNNLDGFDGGYTIVSIENDFTQNAEYLVINATYGIAPPSSSASGRFFTNIQEFDIYEFLMSGLNALDDGLYYVEIKAFTGTNEATPALSEPINLKTTHPDTNLIKYRNYDNAFDITYTTGIVNQIRVESLLYKRLPSGEREVTRNGNGKLVKTYAQKQRRFMMDFFQLPPYLLEKLSVIFDHDYVEINGIEYQTTENMKDPDYKPRYKLANTSIVIEQVGWFKTYNTDDLRPIEESGFVIANGGYIKR